MQHFDNKKPTIANSFSNFLQERKTVDNYVTVESKEDIKDIFEEDEMGDTNEFNVKSDTFSPKENTMRSTSQELMQMSSPTPGQKTSPGNAI